MNRAAVALLLALAPVAAPAAPPRADPAPKVALVTSAGTIVVALEPQRAPITTANFLRYVDAHKLDGTTFYRAARAKSDPKRGLIQGGIDHNIRNSFFPIAHEPTSKTGLHHEDGTISMARNDVGTAMGDFFICVGPARTLDAAPGYPGYAAFGHVARGMDVARRILAEPTYPGGLSIETFGQTIKRRVTIISARRTN
ncbi:peptidylprolyl isomerase [Sphingomonas nostoxanthinifaciens]|uniref:peptidylprolyl isomerase n=1 Tax=Sphingomonas nostoxanthinifaciens TaxID=2872652 RepID=UPI001CC1C496|nr:peptidylprolyl isomerase [Sphingomonas nostoxanthinifaciens]UAK23319.1 peptidylprolyl isomerase [Sphingomonas nostoxanthinifaciens]